MMKKTLFFIPVVLLIWAGWYFYSSPEKNELPLVEDTGSIPVYTLKVIGAFPHDSGAFTQGLVHDGKILYEGTGREGFSDLRKVDLATGQVIVKHELESSLFGEGVTLFDNKVIQLTWHAGTGFVYNKDDFTLIRQFTYPMDGWGITHDGKRLIVSDGSSLLHFLNPHSFDYLGSVQVRAEKKAVNNINELEFIEGEVFANIWPTDWIARIDPSTGQLKAWIDARGLLEGKDRDTKTDVLNGIAYNREEKKIFLTGKLWPKLFEVELVPSQQPSR